VDVLAEGVGFEPTEAQKTSTVFETVPFVRSGSLPLSRLAVKFLERNPRANIHHRFRRRHKPSVQAGDVADR
jgi:hypothetical protein